MQKKRSSQLAISLKPAITEKLVAITKNLEVKKQQGFDNITVERMEIYHSHQVW